MLCALNGCDSQPHLFICVLVVLLSSRSNKNEEGNGGAIRTEIETDICVENSRFVSNQADVVGGAIYNKGKLNVHKSTFEDNAATMVGAKCLSIFSI